ncbi:MAG: hypothetical protein H6818_13315 [Phycisphaerales bacterium]|nr:hypothetical protein [Phycisphaerales bacterium]MCB9862218.1 hypothetical protein [Phycisphaerales bacterium]
MQALIRRFALFIPVVVAAFAQGQIVYWADSGAGRIDRRLPGGIVESVVTGGGPRGLAVDPVERKLYWIDGVSQTLRRADLDGGNPEDLVAGTVGVGGGIALDRAAGKVYWSDVAVGRVFRANLDGSDAVLLGTVGLHVLDIDLDLAAGKMYLAVTSNESILRANLDYSDVEPFISGAADAKSVIVDSSSGVLYWSDGATHRSSLADAAMTVDVSTSDAVDMALDVASQTLYWTTLRANGQMNTDGTGRETWTTTGLTSARSIVLAYARGDVECDGDIDIGDATALVDVLLGAETDTLRVAQADVDGSGAVNGEDVGALVELLLGEM